MGVPDGVQVFGGARNEDIEFLIMDCRGRRGGEAASDVPCFYWVGGDLDASAVCVEKVPQASFCAGGVVVVAVFVTRRCDSAVVAVVVEWRVRGKESETGSLLQVLIVVHRCGSHPF